MGCGKPPPETLAEDYSEYMNEKKGQGVQFAMAGPDVRSGGKMWQNIVWSKFKYGTPGFVWGHGGTMLSIEKKVIEDCEERVGKNDCYIYFKIIVHNLQMNPLLKIYYQPDFIFLTHILHLHQCNQNLKNL